MEIYRIENLTFTYPNKEMPALKSICISIPEGQFVTLCGKSGSGKSTLIRQLKSILAPHGAKTGSVFFSGEPLGNIDERTQAQKIGFVMQSPDNQIVTDKVWHELAFGLESLGYSTPEIRTRVSEIASFFGIQAWFHKNVAELSGGQKQILNLASIMSMQPDVLILDEPTSQLDPIAAQEFLDMIQKINRELGTTIILTEHRLEEAIPMSDRVIVMDSGSIVADGAPREVGERLKEIKHDMFAALPTPMRVFAGVSSQLSCPVTVRNGREWLSEVVKINTPNQELIPADKEIKSRAEPVIELKDVWFRYGKEMPDVVKGLSLKIYQGELFSIVGGNGTGKTTTLSIINSMLTPYRGQVFIDGTEIDGSGSYNRLVAVLPQNPQALFVKRTVKLDLYEVLADKKIPIDEQDRMIAEMSKLCELDELMDMHPYDLSGGEQQRAALAKVLLLKPKILLLDEPTKGLDAHFKQKLGGILNTLKMMGVTIVMVSHDIEFCAEYADRCAMFFDGGITSCDTPRRFFSGKSFYTTAANRMSRGVLNNAVLADDIILALGGRLSKKSEKSMPPQFFNRNDKEDNHTKPDRTKLSPKRIFFAGCFFSLFIALSILLKNRFDSWREYLVQFILVFTLGAGFAALFPDRDLEINDPASSKHKSKGRLTKRTLMAMVMILFLVPLTIYVGVFFLGDRKYYFISLLIIAETLLPFMLIFEGRKPQARELVIISVLCAIGVAGRTAFFMLPHFKPVVAIIIIAGVCFGGETGFLTGAVIGFVSNMFVGQGPWTPWQMFAFGVIGFLAGVLFRKGLLRKRKSSLCIFGGAATLLIYGGIMNSASALMWQANPNYRAFIGAYGLGLPFDLVHTVSTVFFLWFISAPMLEKLDRIKVKYGLI